MVHIVTDHLLLREFEEADYETMLAYQSDPRYLRYYERAWAERTQEEARKFLQGMLDAQQEQPRTRFQLVVALKDSTEQGKLIGNVGVRMSGVHATEGAIGCKLAPDYWNRGYASEATGAIISFGFEQLRLHRLQASTMAPNSGAWRVLEKLGMTRDGELRETTLLASGWANSLIYGILAHEWQILALDSAS